MAPLLVATRMSRIRKPSLSVPSADSFAFFVMRRLGRELVTAGHPAHSFMWWVIGSMPERLFLGLRTPTVKDIRRRALEKKTRLGEGVGGGGERRGERGGAEGTAGGRGTGPGLD